MQRFNATCQPVEMRSGCAGRRVTRLKTNQRGDHLQIVLHPVLKFAHLGVLLADTLFERFAVSGLMRPHVDERGQPESGLAVLVLDQVGVRIGDDDFAGCPFDAEGADKICRRRDGLSEWTFGVRAAQGFPGFAFEVMGALT